MSSLYYNLENKLQIKNSDTIEANVRFTYNDFIITTPLSNEINHLNVHQISSMQVEVVENNVQFTLKDIYFITASNNFIKVSTVATCLCILRHEMISSDQLSGKILEMWNVILIQTSENSEHICLPLDTLLNSNDNIQQVFPLEAITTLFESNDIHSFALKGTPALIVNIMLNLNGILKVSTSAFQKLQNMTCTNPFCLSILDKLDKLQDNKLLVSPYLEKQKWGRRYVYKTNSTDFRYTYNHDSISSKRQHIQCDVKRNSDNSQFMWTTFIILMSIILLFLCLTYLMRNRTSVQLLYGIMGVRWKSKSLSINEVIYMLMEAKKTPRAIHPLSQYPTNLKILESVVQSLCIFPEKEEDKHKSWVGFLEWQKDRLDWISREPSRDDTNKWTLSTISGILPMLITSTRYIAAKYSDGRKISALRANEYIIIMLHYMSKKDIQALDIADCIIDHCKFHEQMKSGLKIPSTPSILPTTTAPPNSWENLWTYIGEFKIEEADDEQTKLDKYKSFFKIIYDYCRIIMKN